jgi:hypothetical protein
MAQENINVGAYPNDPAADPVRIAFLKSQNNFSELYETTFSSGVVRIIAGDGLNQTSQTGIVTLKANIAKVTINTDDNILVGIGTATGNAASANSSNNIFSLKIANTLSTSNIVAANLTGTIRTAAQPVITSVGTLANLTLNVNGTGLTTPSVTANTITANTITSPNISATGGNTQILFNNNSLVGASTNLTFNGTLLTVLGNIQTTNANLGNLARANYVQGTLTTASQPNITSTGTLTSLAVTGNVTAGNATLGNATTSNYFIGDGYLLSNISGTNVTGESANANYSTYSGTAALANVATVAFTVTQNAQPNITSTGTLTSLTVSGAFTGNVITAANDITSSGTISANNFSAINNITGAKNIGAGNVTATQFIGGGGNLNNLRGGNVVGNVTSATVSYFANIPSSASSGAYFLAMTSTSTGNVRLFTNSSFGFNADTGTLNSNNFVALSAVNASSLSVTGDASVGNLATNGTVSATGALVAGSLRSTSSLTVSGLSVTAGLNSTADITTPVNIIGGAVIGTGYMRTPLLTTGASTTVGTITGNWGLSAGSRLTATFADLAEIYAGDRYIEPGTVVDFDGDNEVMESYRIMSSKVAGVVSTDPAYVLNSSMECEFPTMVALQGRVPCKVIGAIRKGDMLISAGGGRARAEESPKIGTVIGKSLENFNGSIGVIEIAIGRL